MTEVETPSGKKEIQFPGSGEIDGIQIRWFIKQAFNKLVGTNWEKIVDKSRYYCLAETVDDRLYNMWFHANDEGYQIGYSWVGGSKTAFYDRHGTFLHIE